MGDINPLHKNELFHLVRYNNLGWVIVHTNEQNYVLHSLTIVFFILADSADPDKMPLSVAFYLRLHCMPKNPFKGFL